VDIFDTFFENLALKFRKEPKFSDLIWIMCSTSDLFQNFFLEFCFEKKISLNGDLVREYNQNGSIPDFYFVYINDNEYIIENKIYDRGDHFEQYLKEFSNADRAFIANYIEREHNGWYIKTWKDFINSLESYLENHKTDTEEIVILKSFLLYLKSITHYWEAETMNFSFLSSLSSFYGIVSELIEELGLQNYNIPSAVNNEYYGQYFYYSKKNGENVYIWLGLYIPEDSGVYIIFRDFENESWLPKEEQSKIINLTSGKYYDDAYEEDRKFYIHLKDEYYRKLCENIDVKIQKDILKQFLEEIIGILK
jgi:hypothetical protein